MSEHALTIGEPPTQDDKLWGAIAHASAFLFIPGAGAIILYLIYKDKSAYIKYQAIQSLVVQIVAHVLGPMTCGGGYLLLLLPLYGAWKAYEGTWETYPLIGGVGK